MPRAILNIVLLLSALSFVQPYSLEAIWKLRTSETSALRTLSSPIYFQFSQELSADSQSTVGYLTITACNILTYNYQVVDSQIFLTFQSVGRSTRNCASGQIAFLRGQLDETFYFYIMYSTLMLMPPNNDLPIKFDIYSITKNPAINGIWTIKSASNDSSIDPTVVINSSRIAFCGGSHIYGYKLSNLVRINATQLKTNASCNQILLQNFSISAQAYRINNLVSPQTSTFFDKNGNQILELVYQSSFGGNLGINPSTFGITIAPPSNNATNQKNVQPVQANTNVSIIAANKTTGNNISNSTNSGNITKINSQDNSPKANSSGIASPIQVNKTSNNSQISIMNNRSVSNTDNNTAQKNVNISQQAVPNNTNASKPSVVLSTPNTSVTTTQKPIIVNNNPSPSIQPLTQTYTIVNDVSFIFGVWYPSSSVLPGKLKPADISVYQILINGGFIMLRGGCNTIVSPYTFSSGSFTPTKVSVTASSCPVNNDAILQDIIYNSSSIYYHAGSGSNHMLRISTQSNATQLILTQNPPSN